MIAHQLNDLSPLIEASSHWAEDSSRKLWLANDGGRVRLARSKPERVFADLMTIDSLEGDLPPVSHLAVLVEWPSGRHRLHYPASWAESAPYEGRPYILGEYDCYTIVRDWMRGEMGFALDEIKDTPERLVNQWLTDGAFVENSEIHKWDRVIMPQRGDGILFCVAPRDDLSLNRANHCGVYLGEGQFLHHFPNRASCVQEFDQTWRGWVVSYMRRKPS